MLITLLSKTHPFFERRLLSTKKTAPEDSINKDDTALIFKQWCSFRLCVVLISLLSALLMLFEIESLEVIIAIFSIGVSSTAQLLRLGNTSTAMCSRIYPLRGEVIETLDAIGMAGVGTVVVLYLLI